MVSLEDCLGGGGGGRGGSQGGSGGGRGSALSSGGGAAIGKAAGAIGLGIVAGVGAAEINNLNLFNLAEEFNQCFEARLPPQNRNLPGGSPIPPKRVTKTVPTLIPTGPPGPQKPPEDEDDEKKMERLLDALRDPNVPPWQKAIIIVGLLASEWAGVIDHP